MEEVKSVFDLCIKILNIRFNIIGYSITIYNVIVFVIIGCLLVKIINKVMN